MDRKMYLSILAALVTATAVGGIALLAIPVVKPLAWALIIGIAKRKGFATIAKNGFAFDVSLKVPKIIIATNKNTQYRKCAHFYQRSRFNERRY